MQELKPLLPLQTVDPQTAAFQRPPKRNAEAFFQRVVTFFNERINFFHSKYSGPAFLAKLGNVAKKAGATTAYYALLLYYALNNDKVPVKDRLLVVAALGYFISPFDFIPDFMLAGLLDDMSVLTYAVSRIKAYIDDDVKQRANEKLATWFGAPETTPAKAAASSVTSTPKQKKTTAMYLYIPFDELSTQIEKKFHATVNFEKLSDHEIRLSLNLPVLKIKLPSSITLTVVEVKPDELVLKYNAGKLFNFMVPTVLTQLLKHKPEYEPAVSMLGDHTLALQPAKIPQGKTLLSHITLRDLTFDTPAAKLFFEMK